MGINSTLAPAAALLALTLASMLRPASSLLDALGATLGAIVALRLLEDSWAKSNARLGVNMAMEAAKEAEGAVVRVLEEAMECPADRLADVGCGMGNGNGSGSGGEAEKGEGVGGDVDEKEEGIDKKKVNEKESEEIIGSMAVAAVDVARIEKVSRGVDT